MSDPLAMQIYTEYLRQLDAVETRGVNLTTWETNFIARIAPKLRRGDWITQGEAYKLEQIYANRTP